MLFIDSVVYNKWDKSHVSAVHADDNNKGYELDSAGNVLWSSYGLWDNMDDEYNSKLYHIYL